MDRILAVGTGRPVTICDEEISLDEPSEGVFATYIRLTRIGGEIAQALNSRRAVMDASRLDALECKLLDCYDEVPTALKLSSQK